MYQKKKKKKVSRPHTDGVSVNFVFRSGQNITGLVRTLKCLKSWSFVKKVKETVLGFRSRGLQLENAYKKLKYKLKRKENKPSK